MIEVESARPVCPFAKGQAAHLILHIQWHSPREPEARSGENSYKRSSLKPCFKTVILGT